MVKAYKKPAKYKVSLRQKLKRDQWKASRVGINPNDPASQWLESKNKNRAKYKDSGGRSR